MPAIADEAGTKLFNLLEMFGRELIRNEIHKNTQLREEADRAKKTAKDLSNAGPRPFTKELRRSQVTFQCGSGSFRQGHEVFPSIYADVV